jgi:SAM-dependent methyltransferase
VAPARSRCPQLGGRGPRAAWSAWMCQEGCLKLQRAVPEAKGTHGRPTSYVQADISTLELTEHFDVGVCGFVMQMFDDLTTLPRALARHVRPGGRVALSVWAEGAWEPHTTAMKTVLAGMRPDLIPNLEQSNRSWLGLDCATSRSKKSR